MGSGLEEEFGVVIRHKFKTVHVHIPKTAGRAISKGLFSTNRPRHVTASQVKAVDPKNFDDYLVFTIVRNPWDRLVSYWCMCKHSNSRPHNNLMKACVDMFGTSEFFDFIRLCSHVNHSDLGLLKSWGLESDLELHPQYYWTHDSSGTDLIDYTGKFESLNNSFNVLCDKLGLQNKKNQLPRVGASSGRSTYPGYYDSESRDMVARIYKLDCITYGYNF